MKRPFIIPIFIPHSGCPHRCVFCNQEAITGGGETLPCIRELQDEIERMLKYKGIKRGWTEVSFFGGNFLGLEPEKIRECLETASRYKESGFIQGIRFSTRPDTISPYTLGLIGQYPVSTVEIGVQSMNNKVLRLSNRGHTSDDSRKAFKELKKTGLKTGAQMMLGLPGESASDCLYSAREIVKLSPDFVRIYPTLVVEGSSLAAWYRRGRYHPLSVKDCIMQMKQLYGIFEEQGIRVIRMGLQATESLSSGSVLAGPYHPSLGHMVLSEIMHDRAADKLRGLCRKGSAVRLVVNPRSYSRMQGLNKANISRLKKEFSLARIDISTDPGLAELSVEAV